MVFIPNISKRIIVLGSSWSFWRNFHPACGAVSQDSFFFKADKIKKSHGRLGALVILLPSGKQTQLLKTTISSEFVHWTYWCSMVFQSYDKLPEDTIPLFPIKPQFLFCWDLQFYQSTRLEPETFGPGSTKRRRLGRWSRECLQGTYWMPPQRWPRGGSGCLFVAMC